MNYKKLTKAQLIAELEKKPEKKVEIKDCTVNNKVWDDKAINAVNDTAKALLNLTELFKSTNIEITGIHIE